MARFYASIQGNRGEATRMGTASSGISGHIRGREVGCRVNAVTDRNDDDVVQITATSGSNGGHTIPLADARHDESGGLTVELCDHPAVIAAARKLLGIS